MSSRKICPHTIRVTCRRREWGRHVFNRIYALHRLVKCAILSHISEPNAPNATKTHLHDILHDHPLYLIAVGMEILSETLSLLL